MIFNSLNFLIFIVVTFLVYVLIPVKARRWWLLIVSYFFYAWNGVELCGYLLGVTLATYFLGIVIEKNKSTNGIGRAKLCIAFGAIICVGLLSACKYSGMLLRGVGIILPTFAGNIEPFIADIIVPLGLSFYTLQSLGYLIDVYRGKTPAERSVINYALFVSFFPQISSGPIGRSYELLPQLKSIKRIDVYRFKEGLFYIAYGLFLKIVVADNIGIVVDSVFASWEDAQGMQLVLAVILYGIQIYGDFCGYTTMAIGVAKVFGIELKTNFRQPYLSTSIKEFWRNWHISLTSWFTDYLYIPLGGNRKGSIRKMANTMIVFLVSGLWHGASAKFVIWGGLNGLFLVLESVTLPTLKRICDRLRIDTDAKVFGILRCMMTFCFVDFAWLFFRADSFRSAVRILQKIFGEFRIAWLLSEKCFDTFGSTFSLAIIVFSVILLTVVDLYEKRKGSIYKLISSQQIVYRWLTYIFLLYIILSWGVYGQGYEQTSFIYFQF